MNKQYLRYPLFCLVLVFAAMVFLSGCETAKGMKKDVGTLTGWDQKMQEELW